MAFFSMFLTTCSCPTTSSKHCGRNLRAKTRYPRTLPLKNSTYAW
jgi:hypothetical protein